MDLPVDRFVDVYILCPTRDDVRGLKRRYAYIKEEVRANRFEAKSALEKPTLRAELEETWTISGRAYKMGMASTKGKK